MSDVVQKRIVVVGSVNADVALHVDRLPGPGETVLANGMRVSGGGKGGNQAVAAGHLAGNIALVARIGSDQYGEMLRKNFVKANLDLASFSVDPDAPTGQAYIGVSETGENNIIVVPGANGTLTAAVLDEAIDRIRGAAFVSTQLEIPLATVEHLAVICQQEGVPFVLNPSPVQPLSAELLSKVALLVLNEHELALLGGDGDEAQKLANLTALGIRDIVLTKGGEGAVHYAAGQLARYPAQRVEVVDTTGAGDTFTGALLVGLAEGKTYAAAIDFAQRAAAIQVTRHGAQDAVPSRDEVGR